MGDLGTSGPAAARRKRAAPLLAAVVAIVTVLASRPATSVTGDLSDTTSISEASRGSSSPADHVKGNSLAELACPTPGSLLPPVEPPSDYRVCWLQTDRCRPGHRHRIDRPPRHLG